MKLFNPFRKKVPAPQEDKPLKERSFHAALVNHTTSDFFGSPSLNIDTKTSLKVVRDRARTLAVNNPYARRALELYKSAILGPDGLGVSVQAKNSDGSIDPISQAIDTHFSRFCESDTFDVTGKFSFQKTQELLLESLVRDGEFLCILRKGTGFGPYNLQLQILDPDHLDEGFNGVTTTGNRIIQSVEVNQFGRPVAYWIWKNNPSEDQNQRNERIRFDAADVIHIFDAERASQQRGYSWMAPVMTQLQHLDRYIEASVVNARLAAAKSVYYSQADDADSWDEDDIDDHGTLSFESSPGAHEILPKGWSANTIDFSAGQDSIENFQKAILRTISVGLGLSYHSLASDMEAVNYSSARFSALTDHSYYSSIQTLIIDQFLKRVYEEHLQIQLLTNNWQLNLPMSKFEKFCSVSYIRPAYRSIDPQKDANADILLLDNQLASVSEILSKRGKNIETVYAEIARDKELAIKYGITPDDINQITN